MARRLFSELSPTTYQIALAHRRMQRRIADGLRRSSFARQASQESLPVKVYTHNSLIRRRLGNAQPELQEGKAVSLGLAAPHVDGILIRPGETFSFWRLVGEPSSRRGFQPGVVIFDDRAETGVGGGLCQFTNLLHWMALHSPLSIVEHHHHSGLDLFPDFKRQIPFGTGTSIVWNFLDYRLRNDTGITFQFRVRTDDEHLRGELRADAPLDQKFHVREEDGWFYEALDPQTGKLQVRRHNIVSRSTRDKRTGNIVASETLLENDALVVYDRDRITEPIRPLSESESAQRR
ncbi:VanW family protein [Kocuria palustris]|jgi:vancomycin resistance protein VanW|uniref:VanW family protein n=1 Tax=Kocuria palustris TaxID=71999 RepID=UPI0019D110B4|nr:VanW family protein [Kocuria palustris]MBN6753648.1 VanW family protein [Kocuria palustris]MBN6758468.1 VanW family protein [Kocuria palustris]MBN6763811.1 VanW family protein [Kocuria palustris]MBN6783153.1 VanW family protein [Kocuria palustris]MBN6799671.1 VanW family protein [Kocuria palustris]